MLIVGLIFWIACIRGRGVEILGWVEVDVGVGFGKKGFLMA